ncbi:MAG: imidazole glycerol phosphate synthase subunit HisH [Gammaproteobacteria bacterium]|nr:imidazole glycerol phosphate synthase subunit HisH [Gammaproteobacteria bacterium]
MTQVAIIDSGGANITSLLSAFERLGVAPELTADATQIRGAERVVLPGVGAARDAMSRLHTANLVDVIRGLAQPVLGICLGMQLLCERSAEDDVECLGIIPGRAGKLPVSAAFPVPNMGWCATRPTAPHPILDSIESGDHFYFVHSYAVPESEYTIATARHAEPFSAMLGKDNFVAAQFHPERSSKAGARILSNFLEWTV